MSFDTSRYTFDRTKSYAGVVAPQGRVQSDADWNEWLAEISRRRQAGTLDVFGGSVYPMTTPNAFFLTATANPSAVLIGCGRMYVDGLLVENFGDLASAKWDGSLGELSNAPQPAPASITGAPNIAFDKQPYLPGAKPPSAAGSYLFYLDVWTRPVTWLQDSELIDKAIGVDTTGRLQTVWQVRYMDAGKANASNPGTPVTCSTPDSGIAYPARSYGRLTSGTVPNQSTGPCCMSTGSGYTGVENQNYRVQIHKGGGVGTATFKWSRENGSVMTGVTKISTAANANNNNVSVLTVTSLGRDQVLNFSNGDWVELLNDTVELDGQPDANSNAFGAPGQLCQIDTADPATNTITLTAKLSNASFPDGTPDAALNTRIRRWDQKGIVYSVDSTGKQTQYFDLSGSDGGIPVPAAGTLLELENGVTAAFSLDSSGTTFLSGDFWSFSARTFDGSVDQVKDAPPFGVHHHYTKLGVVTFPASGSTANATDCRTPWKPGGDSDCGCCTVTVGDGVTSFGKFSSIQQAINSLPVPGGGEVCILPGKYHENIAVSGLSEVTMRGAGPRTTLYGDPQHASVSALSGLKSVITVTGSTHIRLKDFAMEAPDGMCCILIDELTTDVEVDSKRPRIAFVPKGGAGSEALKGGKGGIAGKYSGGIDVGYLSPFEYSTSCTDVVVEELVLTASTAPAVAAVQASLVTIRENRIAMKDVASQWPAVYVSGSRIDVCENWIGLLDSADAGNYITDTAASDLAGSMAPATGAAAANGGVQIGGYSSDVSIARNRIEGGAFNAVSLGSFLLFDGTNYSGTLNGVLPATPATGAHSAGGTLVLPGTVGNFSPQADGPLQGVVIEDNTINAAGLCGVGPVAFFSSGATAECISVAALEIRRNTFAGCLGAPISPLPEGVANIGYGVICLPDLQGVSVHDNIVRDFGAQAGAHVCGIFVLNGEDVEIADNDLRETRDWEAIPPATQSVFGGTQAGIAIMMVSPPALKPENTASAWTGSSSQGVQTAGAPPVYQPGLPALRITGNVVRVATGLSLGVMGYGPFAITGNHFSSGGTVPELKGDSALNIVVMNLGTAIELDPPTSFYQWYTYLNKWGDSVTLPIVDKLLANSTCGSVDFSHNICQVETRGSGANGTVSTMIMTLDHLHYGDNVSWMDGSGKPVAGTGIYAAAVMDALLVGATVQVVANRFQECLGSVLWSALTVGALNVTAENISSFCLYTLPASANINNLSATNAKVCLRLKDALWGAEAKTASLDTMPLMNVKFAADSVAANPVQNLNTALSKADAQAGVQVHAMSNVHQARLAQVERMADVATAVGGADSEGAKAAATAVKNVQAKVDQIHMLDLQVNVTPPDVAAEATAVYGHVFNGANQPIEGYSVYLVDANNTFQPAYGVAYTQVDGSYRMVSAEEPAGDAASGATATGAGAPAGSAGSASGAATGAVAGTTLQTANLPAVAGAVTTAAAAGAAPSQPAGEPAAAAPASQALYVQVSNAAGDPVYTSTTAYTPVSGLATYQAVKLPVAEKPLGVLPTVLRQVTLPVLKQIQPNPVVPPNPPAPNPQKSKG